MYPAAFEYVAPSGVAEAVRLLDELGPDAEVLGGGQSLIPLMKLRLATPSHLVDIGGIDDLRGLGTADGGELRIGCLVTESELEHSPLVRERWPVLAEASALIADPLVRNLATVGGNLAHGDPANDHPAVMISLGAEVGIAGPAGERTLPAEHFFEDMFETALAGDEVLTEIRVPPMPATSACAYVKRERQGGDYAIAGAAVWVRAEGGIVAEAKIVLTNAGPVPVRAYEAEDRLRATRVRDAPVEQAAVRAGESVTVADTIRGSAAYRRHMARLAVEEALGRALDAASSGGRG